MRKPDQVGRRALFLAACVWVAAWAGRAVGPEAIIVCLALVLALAALRKPAWSLVAVVALAGAISGFLSSHRDLMILESVVPEGTVEVRGVAMDDPRPGATGSWFLLRPDYLQTRSREVTWDGPPLLISSTEPTAVMAGDSVAVAGRLRSGSGTARGDPFAGRIDARAIDPVEQARGFFRVANLIRSRVEGELAAAADRPSAALLSGFLIGDVRGLPQSDQEALRRAGLSHYVAVSGSNVALFLMLWWVIVGPLGFGSRRRAAFGIVGLVLFAIVTRWEPSVLRAAVMAGFILTARAFGISVGPWTALGGGVAGLLLVSGELVSDVGFQLSVAATAGVIAGAGSRPFSRLPLVGAALAATVSAQLAVAPLLLIHFGTLPLLSPLTNLLAGPLVMIATSLGGIGVLAGSSVLTGPAILTAGVVLGIARSAAPWPQIGWIGFSCVGMALLVARLPGARRVMTLFAAVWAFLVIGISPTPVHLPAVVFLDVGQGDSTLFLDRGGAVVLIDGGPDPGVLIERLRHYGVDHVDLVVASHQHHDHVAGLRAALTHFPVGRLWHSGETDRGPEIQTLLDLAEAHEVPVEAVGPGWTASVGHFQIEVVGPVRRYASPNDQSVVLLVEMGDTTVLMPGDIETFAQSDLGVIRADILKVPHQGAATSDLDWLAAVGADIAVIPVGPNDYGHPSPDVVELLEATGAQVFRTDRDGDVAISGR